MKKFLLILLGTLIALPTIARDFEYTYQGQTLKYTITDEGAKTCKVAKNKSISGNLVIPSVANDGTTEYSVTAIGNRALFDCEELTSVTMPNSVTIIGDYSFYLCQCLPSVTIPNSVTSIGDFAFSRSGLTSVDIPNSTISIGDEAFEDCGRLTSLTIGNSVTSIGEGAFCRCGSLSSVIIPNSVVSISKGAFSGCQSLTSVTIGNSVTSIGVDAFEGCESLTSITIPPSVVSIGNGAFANCHSLNSIDVSPENLEYASLDGVLLNKDLSTIIQFPGGRTGDYTIPTPIKSIGSYAFHNCTKLTSVEIGSSVVYIGKNAFNGCSELESVEIGSSVTSIDDDAFGWCINLTSIEIPNSVTSIGHAAFSGCLGLESVTIPSSITSIGYRVFSFCIVLNTVYYGADEPIEGDDWMFDESTYNKATLYMSEKGAAKARTIYPWRNFAKIEVYDFPDGIEYITADVDTDKPCEVYSISGAKVGNTTESLAPGVYIVRQGNAAKKISVQ